MTTTKKDGLIKRSISKLFSFGGKVTGAKYIKEGAMEIKESGSKILTTKFAKNARHETYEEALERLQTKPEELKLIYSNYVFCFWVSFIGMVLCFGGVLYSLFITQSILIGASFIGIMAIMLANSFRFSFNTFRMRHKKLCSAKLWWDASSEWIPSSKI